MTRTLPRSEHPPHALYRAAQVREFDRLTIEEFGMAGAQLMERAGVAAFELLRRRWPEARHLSLLCGVGNNGGDGYVVARLALTAGLEVSLLQLGDPERLQGDARAMADAYAATGGTLEPFRRLPDATDLILDAVLGTGLERPLTGAWAQALEAVNRHRAPVLAIDIPSGLHSDTGQALGVAVRAAATISFIGLKQGMYTASGPDCCGDIYFDSLEVPARIYGRQVLAARRVDWSRQSSQLGPRRRNAHKGDFGHVLVIGGAPGFAGAVRMAGEAAVRSGAGLVSLATDPSHAASIAAGRPELMCHGVAGSADLASLLARASVVVLGPGLGLSDWARALLARVLDARVPLVMDADALNLLAEAPRRRDDWVLTPHPGEASRLLGLTVSKVESDRFASVRRLQERFGGMCLLKGAGTLVQGPGNRVPAVCSDGNPGMASGGMGDVLSGIIGALIAQGFELDQAAELGVCLHARAGDLAAQGGERGLLATDLLGELRPLLNPEVESC